MTCEDFPCCGHEYGCCPDFDDEGRQLNMRCTCGTVLPVDNDSSVCGDCYEEWLNCDVADSMDGDHESALRDAGWGTDEDYGYFGGEDW